MSELINEIIFERNVFLAKPFDLFAAENQYLFDRAANYQVLRVKDRPALFATRIRSTFAVKTFRGGFAVRNAFFEAEKGAFTALIGRTHSLSFRALAALNAPGDVHRASSPKEHVFQQLYRENLFCEP